MRRSDIKRFIREACGSPDHYAGEELHTHIRDSLSNGGTPFINVSCPDRDGYVVVCDVLDDLSHRDARHNVDMGFEGFFENDFGDDVFFLFSIEDVDPSSLEIHNLGEDETYAQLDDSSLNEEPSLRRLTKEFLLEKIVD